MSSTYDYQSEKQKIDKLQNWWAKQFEKQLEEYFRNEGQLLKIQPVLADGKKPDFLIGDVDNRHCYVEAKVRHNSFEQDRYFDKYFCDHLLTHDAVDGKSIVLKRVEGKPKRNPPVDELVAQIKQWLTKILDVGLEPPPSKTFVLSGVRIEVAATRSHYNNRLLRYENRGIYSISRNRQHSWLSEKAGDAAKKYTPKLLGGVPLVLAVLNLSKEVVIESHIYGKEEIQINTVTGNFEGSLYDGATSLWNGSDRIEKLRNLSGVWFWSSPGIYPPKRPVLYTNLEVEGIELPSSLYGFDHATRGPESGTSVSINRGDGGKPYQSDILIKAWDQEMKELRNEV